MPVGTIKLNSNILDNYTQKNFETFMDGVGKPISKQELESSLGDFASKSPLVANALDYSKSTLDHLTNEVKKNKLIDGLEKALNGIGKAVGAVVGGIKNIVSNILKKGLGTISSALKKVANMIKNSKLFQLIKTAVKAIISILGIPLTFLGKIVKKVASLISKGLAALGLKNKFKTALNKNYNNALDKGLNKTITRATYTGILSEVPLEDDGLYFTSKKLIQSDPNHKLGYDHVMKSLKYIIHSGMKANTFKEDEYYSVLARLEKEYGGKYGIYKPNGFKDDEEEFYIRTVFNKPNYTNMWAKLPIIDETRGWMGYDPNFLSGLSNDELIMLSKNKNVSKYFPSSNVSGRYYKSYFDSLNNQELSNYEKLIIYSEYKRQQYYDSVKKKKELNGTKANFSGFLKDEDMPELAKRPVVMFKKDKTTSL